MDQHMAAPPPALGPLPWGSPLQALLPVWPSIWGSGAGRAVAGAAGSRRCGLAVMDGRPPAGCALELRRSPAALLGPARAGVSG